MILKEKQRDYKLLGCISSVFGCLASCLPFGSFSHFFLQILDLFMSLSLSGYFPSFLVVLSLLVIVFSYFKSLVVVGNFSSPCGCF